MVDTRSSSDGVLLSTPISGDHPGTVFDRRIHELLDHDCYGCSDRCTRLRGDYGFKSCNCCKQHVVWYCDIFFDMELKNKYLEYRSEEHTSELQSRGHLVCR